MDDERRRDEDDAARAGKPADSMDASQGSQGEVPPSDGDKGGDGVPPPAAAAASSSSSGAISLRGVFLGNLTMGFRTEEVMDIFTKPHLPRDVPEGTYLPIQVDRVDLKRGYCFVFLKDVANMEEKERVERFVSDINGMQVPNVSNALRAEFARGDGKVKRKEDERKRNIQPSETLFVVNFHEETTKKDDLEMLFAPYGELVRIDMKGNYAFVQFRSIEEAMRAKDATNGGKLDRSVLTVEFVANRRNAAGGDRGGRGGGWRGGGRYDDRRYDDRRGPPRGPPSRYGGGYDNDRGRSRYDDRPRYDEPRYRDRSPDRYRRRSRSRSYSPPQRYRSRSPDRGGRYDDRDRGRRYDDYRDSGRDGRGRAPSPPPRDSFRGDRGYSDRDGGGGGGDRDSFYNRGGSSGGRDGDRGYRP